MGPSAYAEGGPEGRIDRHACPAVQQRTAATAGAKRSSAAGGEVRACCVASSLVRA